MKKVILVVAIIVFVIIAVFPFMCKSSENSVNIERVGEGADVKINQQ